MRTIVVALAVALVTASSSTAAFVVTSKNIKNGTIQLVDISPKATKALRGQRGLRGPSGLQEVTLVETLPPRIIPPGTSSSAEARCPAGQQPISGGFSNGSLTVTGSVPVLSNKSWVVFARNDTSAVGALTAFAYCAANVNVIPLGMPTSPLLATGRQLPPGEPGALPQP
jgi:hypothetical protein